MAVAPDTVGGGYRLGLRVPLSRRSFLRDATRVIGRDIPSRIVARASATTTDCDKDDANLCEKPEGSSSMVLPIVLGIVIPLTIIGCVLLYLHRRNVRRVRQEDTMDPHKSLDFGLVMDPSKNKKTKRQSSFFGGEKDMFSPKHRQLSMDMNLSSPYLLPPELQTSRESLHSLARTLHQNEDPYRPVAQYAGSDVGSLRSFKPDGRSDVASSIYPSSPGLVEDGSGFPRSGSATGMRIAPRSKSPLPPYPGNVDNVPAPLSMSPSKQKDASVLEPVVTVIETTDDVQSDIVGPVEADSKPVTVVAELQVPPPVASKISRKGLPASPRPQDSPQPTDGETITMPDQPPAYNGDNHLVENPPAHAGFDLGLETPHKVDSREEPLALSLPNLALGGPFDDETFLPGQATTSNEPTVPHVVLHNENQAPIRQDSDLFPDDPPSPQDDVRGRALHRRQSSEYPQEQMMRQSALGLPQMDGRRLSVGFRPLPPDELIESEDPETRANRIRSFYKEYFDDTRPDLSEYNQHYPPQGLPAEWRNATGGIPPAGGAQYYEDHDPSYMAGEANAYFDPQSNTFVMPYAQPVSRRAMTPPPSGSRFLGGRPRGGSTVAPRNFHGSMSGMGMPGRPGMPRPGSSMSNQMGPRPGSSVSNRLPRSASGMSGRIGGGPRKPLPPPEDLVTLPTPSKLKNDSFALMGALEFAPPPTLRDQASGRSQSPLGERRPYQMNIPAASPLVSAFDEMAALPSPYLLRKSSTFTALDFAPPRKFKDNDTMSDAGSIRSNRSGISAVQQAAIRGGAGRVSRLPGDTVFTQASLSDQLKPSWGMRP